MKRVETRSPKTIEIVYRGLIIIIALLVLVLIIGTIYGLLKRTSVNQESDNGSDTVSEAMFSGLGTMRIVTADSEPETLLVSIAFPYDKNDRPFSEEIASNLSRFKMLVNQYLGGFTAKELELLDTDIVRQELLSRFNSELRLGKIKEIYIHEFMRL